MIKMYINNEEVVSNKEFTISEEMLATPSTVLNNCYPALWENTKDYVSKFYFPKDYSKCIIGDGEFEKGSQRNIIKKVSGISPSFETNITKPWESLTIDGKSTQETRSGKNLFDLGSLSGTKLGGVTLTQDTDGGFLLNGTTTGVARFRVPLTTELTQPISLYLKTPDTNGNIMLVLRDSNVTMLSNIRNNKATEKVGTYTGTTNVKYIELASITTGVTYTNYKIYPMVVLGTYDISTIGEYEPYGVMPSPDYPSEIENVKGKNLFYNVVTSSNPSGITLTQNDDGSMLLNGTTTGVSKFDFRLPKALPAGTYTFSIKGSGNIPENVFLRARDNNATMVSTDAQVRGNNTTQNSHTFTCEKEIATVSLNITTAGTIFNNFVIKPQLEKGSVATRYVPYGNIQIVETGKNLFDKDNAENGYRLGNDGLPFPDPSNTLSQYIKVKPNTTYHTNFKLIWSNCICEYSKDKTFILRNQSKLNTFTTSNNCEYIRITCLITQKDELQLEKGPTATDYEPYTEEVVNIDLKGNELCSLPNGTKDELIVKDGRAKILKKIDEVKNGTIEAANVYTNIKYFQISKPTNYKNYDKYVVDYNLLFTHATTKGSGENWGSTENIGKISSAASRTHFWIGFPIDTTLEQARELLSNNCLYYELAEPYEIDLGEVTLPNTLIGQNNVTLDATLETNMEISYYYSSYDLLFAGVVKKTGNISLNPRYPHYADIQVLDFKTFLSEGETLNFVIDNKTIGQAIDMVIDAIKSYGFVKGNIMLDDINEVIRAYSTDKKTAYDVFQYFSDITNSRWFTRMIDEDTVAIDFYDTDKLPVKPKIEYTEDWFCNNLIDDMSYSIKTDDYRNKQILLSDEVFGSTPYNDLLTSNGYDTSYTTTGKIASLTSAKIDGKNATFTTEANKEGGVEADIYYKPGEVGITTNNQIGAGKVIEITYIPLVEGREIIINDEEVNRIGSQLNRNGVISRYENRNDTTSSDELRQIGQTYIKYKGKAEVTLKITSRKNIYDIGDKVQFDAPLEDLSTEYMVKKKTTKYIVTANQLFYDYELSSSFNSESEINYFDNQRSKHKGNLSEGDYITRDIDITNSANIIWHDTSINEISITGNNILDCSLDSPFTD